MGVQVVAWDLESELIAERKKIRSKSGESISVSPMVYPKVVLGSAAWGGEVIVASPEEMAERLQGWLNSDTHLVGHNCCGFDIPVICQAFPDLQSLFERAAEEGRLSDTMYLDLLVGLACGRFDRPVFDAAARTWSVPDPRSRSLDTLAQEYCGLVLDKDPAIRLTYGQFRGKPLADLPAAHRRYAEDDARATLRVYQELERCVARVSGKNKLSESLQIRAALALSGLEQRGVRVDRALAGRLAASFEEQLGPLKERLVAAGLGRWDPRPKTRTTETITDVADAIPTTWYLTHDRKLARVRFLKTCVKLDRAEADFHLNTLEIQAALAALPLDENDPPPRRADKTLGLDADYWDGNIPKEGGALCDWQTYAKVTKILATYLSMYSQTSIIFPRWNVLGARSGRMSASRPNLQNIPKRRAGIRALFVPAPGRVLVVADYAAQEMFTLCEVMLDMGIIGPLYQALTSGADFHRTGAGLVLGKDPKDVTKEERQAQKALHFGVPGGLGARKLAAYAWSGYGVDWSVEEAAARRQRFLDVYTDVAAYLRRLKTPQDAALRAATGEGVDYWREKLGLQREEWNVIRVLCAHPDPAIAGAGHTAERSLMVELGSGRLRAHCRFTEGANTYFQGTASDVTKAAVWRAHRAGLEVVMVVHDEIVVECDGPSGDEWGLAGAWCEAGVLRDCMLAAFREICPRMGPYAGVEVKTGLTRWGPATDLTGKEIEV